MLSPIEFAYHRDVNFVAGPTDPNRVDITFETVDVFSSKLSQWNFTSARLASDKHGYHTSFFTCLSFPISRTLIR